MNQDIKLTPAEVRLLSKVNKKTPDLSGLPGYFQYDKELNVEQSVEMFYRAGFIELTAKGRYHLTEKGEEIISKNDALLLWYNGLKSTLITAQEIVYAQEHEPERESKDLLIDLYREHIRSTDNRSDCFSLLVDLQRLYQWKHDDTSVEEIQRELDELNEQRKREREAEARRLDEVLGLSIEERQALQQQAIDEMDDEWEKQLDKENKLKAGIEPESRKEMQKNRIGNALSAIFLHRKASKGNK